MAYNHAKGYAHYVKDFGLIFIPVPKNGSSSFRRSCEHCRISNVEVDFLKNQHLFITSKVVAVVNPDLVSRFISGFLEVIERKEKDPWSLTERILHFKSLEEQILEMIKILEEGRFYDAHIEKTIILPYRCRWQSFKICKRIHPNIRLQRLFKEVF